jgi:hypothetical protein
MMAAIGALGGAASAATGLSALTSIAGGFAAAGQAAGEKERAEINAHIGRTRAMQSDVNARTDLASELGTLRSTLSANGQGMNVGSMEVMKDLRGVRSRERRIEFGNQMQQAADWRMEAKNAGAKRTGALLGGLINAGPDMLDLYQLKRRKG